MTNSKTTMTVQTTNHHVRAALTALAMLAAMLMAGGMARAATTFANSSQILIVDNGPADPYASQINVQNLSGTVSDVNLKLNGYTHSFPEDVGVLLVGPQGQKAFLMSDVGGGDDTINVNFTLDDEAANFLPDNSVITSGAYKPTQGTVSAAPGDCPAPANFPVPAPAGPYASNLSAFDNTDPNGTWDLYVIDDCFVDFGHLAGGWSLEITTESNDPQSDNTAPRVTSTNPAAGATGVSPTANVKATFSEDMQSSTINGATFELFKKGSTTKLAAKVGYDTTVHRATLGPTNSLKRGATYKAVVTTDAKDLAANRLDQNPSLSGLQQKRWFFTVKR